MRATCVKQTNVGAVLWAALEGDGAESMWWVFQSIPCHPEMKLRFVLIAFRDMLAVLGQGKGTRDRPIKAKNQHKVR